MDLILWRHADAEPALVGIDDLERPLTAKGRRQAKRVAQWLADALPEGTRIVASPAKRALQTVQPLGRGVETVAAVGPGASAAELLAAAGWPDAAGAVLVVGHQPTLGEAAALVMTGSPLPWTIKKGAVWWLRRGDDGRVALVGVRGPEDA